MKSILLVKRFWGLVEMTCGLVNASFSLPKWQAVKTIFFAPCIVLFSLLLRTIVVTKCELHGNEENQKILNPTGVCKVRTHLY